MAIQSDALITNAAADTLLSPEKRIVTKNEINVLVGTDASASTIARMTPMGLNESTSKYGKWLAPDPSVATVDNSSASGGSYTLTVNGGTTAAIAYNATVSVVTAALKAIGYDVTVTLDTGVYTITFDGAAEIKILPTVTADDSSITGTQDFSVAAGTATNGLNRIRGFAYPGDVDLSATKDTMMMMSVEGTYNYNDILETVDSGDATALQTALRDDLVGEGMIIQGLTKIH